MRIIEYYITKHDGIAFICLETSVDRVSDVYRAWWSPSFCYQMQIESTFSYSLSKTREDLLRWDSDATPIKDLGDFPLFKRNDEEGISVSTKENVREGFTERVLAKDVPNGAFLAYDALHFFMFYRGQDSVDGDARILLR